MKITAIQNLLQYDYPIKNKILQSIIDNEFCTTSTFEALNNDMVAHLIRMGFDLHYNGMFGLYQICW